WRGGGAARGRAASDARAHDDRDGPRALDVRQRPVRIRPGRDEEAGQGGGAGAAPEARGGLAGKRKLDPGGDRGGAAGGGRGVRGLRGEADSSDETRVDRDDGGGAVVRCRGAPGEGDGASTDGEISRGDPSAYPGVERRPGAGGRKARPYDTDSGDGLRR